MGKIKQMNEALANQIAAGEVVERPASVVKELVENAIDAGSTEIRVELLEAGIQSIKVVDNGEGMDATDLQLAFLPHATSKIYDLADLFHIHSLGFRGEALASIASVAQVDIQSQQAGAELGHRLLIKGSQVLETQTLASRQGTSIIVSQLFYNTPARLKHLKTIRTELYHSLNLIQEIALAHPAIRFELISEGQQIFASYGSGQLQQAIANVYQPSIARQMVAVQGQNADFIVSGFLSPPQLTRTSRYHIHWIINGRPVKSYALSEVLIKAYGRQLMIGRYPLAVIQIELDPRLVDVNVHPTKQQVRLSKEEDLSHLIRQLVEQMLEQINPIPLVASEADDKATDLNIQINQTVEGSYPSKEPHPLPLVQETPTVSSRPFQRIQDEATHSENFITQTPNRLQSDLPSVKRAKQDEKGIQVDLFHQPNLRLGPDFSQLRYVGQIHGTYLIAESAQGFYLIDQHAAQEKIRYEALMDDALDITDQQQLLIPYVFEYSQAEMLEIQDLLPQLELLGISLSVFGPNAFQLEAYPTWMEADAVEETVQLAIQLLKEQQDLSPNQVIEHALIMNSCRGAIKANHHLEPAEAINLIEQMAELRDPFHCPHGRPVFVEFNENSLEKLFKRIQDPHQGGQAR